MSRTQIYADADALTAASAELVVEAARAAIAARGEFRLALSGGSTPRPIYELLATPDYAARIDWGRVSIWFGDERCVPPDHATSNYRMAREALLDRVPVHEDNIHRMRGEDPPEQAAADYEAQLAGQPLDLVLLGMGDNGHTASLFPGLPAVTEEKRRVLAQYVEVAGMWRITLTPPAINAAHEVAFVVAGRGKAAMLHRVLEGPRRPVELPAQAIHPASGLLHWMIDREAAARLEQDS